MNKLMKFPKVILTIVMMLCVALPTLAHDFKVDGIYYNYLNKTAKTVKVTYRGSYSSDYSNEYTGSVTIPSSVTYSGTTYSVTSIDSWAFSYCSGLTSVTIPNSVTSIDSWAFDGCTGLTEVNITDLSAWCKIDFYHSYSNPLYYAKKLNLNGTEIKDLVIPNDITEIKNYAFYNCSGLTSITIPNSVTSIGNYAFCKCSGLTEVIVEDGNTKYDSRNNCNGIIETATNTLILGCKNTFIPNSVTSIGDEAFWCCVGLTSVTIPYSVTSIGNYAFDDCTGLAELIIEDGQETLSLGYNYYSSSTIGGGLFYDCPIEKLYLGRNLDYNTDKSYGYSPFYNKTKLKEVKIGNSVTSIGNYAFGNCTGLTKLILEDGTESISGLSFPSSPIETLYLGRNTSDTFVKGKTTLKEVTIGNSVTSIGNSAFEGCSGLTSVTIPNSVTDISEWAFYGCKGLTSITIPNSVTSIGNYAFYGCDGLISITIPNSVTSIGNYAFVCCSGLTSITIPNSVTSIGNYAFSGCTGLTSITIPNSVTDISEWAFSSCSGLTSVTIPNSVTSIGNYAFECCSGLTSVIIGDSVSSIGASAFYGCSNLIESNNVISPTSVKVNLNTQCSSNLVPCIAINNKYYTNNTLVESLDSEYNYNYDLGLKFKDNFILIGSSSFLTGELELTTQAAKATSSSSVRLIATTNCDATAGTGFEWLRYDAPAELPPNKVSCPIVDGMLIGSLRGVRDDAYYKYRPFYTSASGKTYYGEWIAFFTGDANVYFEPEVQTYYDYAITDNSVVVKGYALEGTDEITAQGFEYWKTGSTILPSSTENRMTVMASGIKMSATLANLEYNSTYKYRAFVTTAKGTIYGNEVEFETGEDPVGVENIVVDDTSTIVEEIARYDIHGRLLSKPSRGINIIIYSDGTTRKEIVKE